MRGNSKSCLGANTQKVSFVAVGIQAGMAEACTHFHFGTLSCLTDFSCSSTHKASEILAGESACSCASGPCGCRPVRTNRLFSPPLKLDCPNPLVVKPSTKLRNPSSTWSGHTQTLQCCCYLPTFANVGLRRNIAVYKANVALRAYIQNVSSACSTILLPANYPNHGNT